MVQYWIATSNWYKEIPKNYRPCSSAVHRNERHIWWYSMRRDYNIHVGDMVLVYQSCDNKEAKKENIKIDNEIKCSFIGNFTIGRLIDRDDPTNVPRIQDCWTEPDDGWLRTVEDNFLWQNEFIKRRDIDDDLLKTITGSKNVGLVFRNKTWIRLAGTDGYNYYNRVMDKHYNQP